MSPTSSPTIFNEYCDINQEKCYIAETQLFKAQGCGLDLQYKWSEKLSLGDISLILIMVMRRPEMT